MRSWLFRVSFQVESWLKDARAYLKNNTTLMVSLGLILLAGYGFELFNLNLTIDEEIHAFSANYSEWISQGRWGMYLLHRFLLPQPVIPFVPLFITLVFHLIAILIFMRCWGLVSLSESLIAGAIGVSFSGMAFVYAFSILNYGIGIGLFLVSVSLLIYSKTSGWKQFYAAIPACFAFSIYQPLLLVFVCGYLIYYISTQIQASRKYLDFLNLMQMVGISLLALLLYLGLQRIFTSFSGPGTGYIADIVDTRYLFGSLSVVFDGVWSAISRIYTGDVSVFGLRIWLFRELISVAIVGMVVKILRSRESAFGKMILSSLAVGLMLIPFGSVLATKGILIIRSLIALPVALSGCLALSMLGTGRLYKLLLGILTAICTFQFVVSSNLLFSSSRLSLEADRLLATEIVTRIDTVRSEAGAHRVKYLEVIGYIDRPVTPATPKIEIFGASFFEWDHGNIYRIVYFLKLMGFNALQAMPPEKRAEFIEIGNAMPVWPDPSSVVLVDDSVLVKFGPYSDTQKQWICEAVNIQNFCETVGVVPGE